MANADTKIKILMIHYCSECKKQTSHFLRGQKWKENTNITQILLLCKECENLNSSWIHLKENNE